MVGLSYLGALDFTRDNTPDGKPLGVDQGMKEIDERRE